MAIDEREPAYSKHLTLAVWLFLFAVQVLQSWLSPLSSDDALFASVALSVATGRGYGVPIMEHLYLFHFSISSGPVVILPGAMMMMIFGNAYWVPAMTATLLIQSLLVASFMALRRVPEIRGRLWHTALLVLVLWLTFTTGNYTLRPGSRSFLWYGYMGDIPSALWVVLAILVAAGDTQSSTRRVVAGVCFAMAALTKQLTMLASACAAATICLHVFRTTSTKDAVRCAVQIALGAALPLTIWHFYIAASLGLSGYGEWLQSEYGAMSAIAFVVGQHTENAVVVQQHPLAKVAMVWRYSGLLAAVILYPLAAWVLASVRRPASSGLEIAGVGLVLGGILQISWWVLLSIPMTRYLTPAMIYLTAGLVFALSAKRTRSPQLLLTLCLLLVCGRLPLSAAFVREAGQRHPARDELLHAADVLENLRRQGYTLLSCGVSFELEYVMPETRNFHTCGNEPPADASVVAVSYVVAGRVAYYTADAHYVRIDQPPRWLQTHCLPVVASSRFAVWKCGGRPLARSAVHLARETRQESGGQIG